MQAIRMALFAGLAMAIAAPSAAEPVGQFSIRVRYGDLDLSSAEGARTLQLRLRQAVNRVCAIERSRDRWDYEVTVACQRRTLARVRTGVAPALAAAERTRLAASAPSGASTR